APVACARRPAPAARSRRGAGAGPRDRAVTLRPGTSSTEVERERGVGTDRARTLRSFCIPRPCVVPFGGTSEKRPNCSNEPVPDGAVCEALGAWRLGGD